MNRCSFRRPQPEHANLRSSRSQRASSSIHTGDGRVFSLCEKLLRTVRSQRACPQSSRCGFRVRFGEARVFPRDNCGCLSRAAEARCKSARARGVGRDGFTVPVAALTDDMRLSGTVMRVQRIQRSVINSPEPMEGVKIPPHWLIKSLNCMFNFSGATLYKSVNAVAYLINISSCLI